tara:strand:+ start:857 stop:1021 length:165 start_codon:yes stop_codon:yes gene_type:complete
MNTTTFKNINTWNFKDSLQQILIDIEIYKFKECTRKKLIQRIEEQVNNLKTLNK